MVAVSQFITAGDVKQLALLFGFAPFALLPEAAWPLPCALADFVASRRQFGHWRALEARLPPELPALAGMSPGSFLHESERRFLEDYLQVLRANSWCGWRPELTVAGLGNISEALDSGNGAVLWVSGSLSSDLVTKMALSQSGMAISHLSRTAHGFSTSPFGVRFLNPLRQQAESRYLRERIVMDSTHTVGPLRALRTRLSENGVVSISVGETGSSTLEVPVLGGTYRVAIGPIQLAHSSGAALLPVFAARTRRGAYEVRIHTRIDQRSASSRPHDCVAEVGRFGELLRAFLQESPCEWTGWRTGALKF